MYCREYRTWELTNSGQKEISKCRSPPGVDIEQDSAQMGPLQDLELFCYLWVSDPVVLIETYWNKSICAAYSVLLECFPCVVCAICLVAEVLIEFIVVLSISIFRNSNFWDQYSTAWPRNISNFSSSQYHLLMNAVLSPSLPPCPSPPCLLSTQEVVVVRPCQPAKQETTWAQVPSSTSAQ